MDMHRWVIGCQRCLRDACVSVLRAEDDCFSTMGMQYIAGSDLRLRLEALTIPAKMITPHDFFFCGTLYTCSSARLESLCR